MMKRKVPKRLWDYGLIWVCEKFGFYDWVTYTANAGLGELLLGRWLGVSHKVGKLMSY